LKKKKKKMKMDDRGASFVAVRRTNPHGETFNSNSAEAVAGSAAWLGRGLSCVCAQRRDSDASSFFDLTIAQEESLQRLQRRIDVPYDSSVIEHQVSFLLIFFGLYKQCGNSHDVHQRF
jgi:hypothetical protein